MQNNMQLLKSICRIVHCLYSAYSAYICTPHFADDVQSGTVTYISSLEKKYKHVRTVTVYVHGTYMFIYLEV